MYVLNVCTWGVPERLLRTTTNLMTIRHLPYDLKNVFP